VHWVCLQGPKKAGRRTIPGGDKGLRDDPGYIRIGMRVIGEIESGGWLAGQAGRQRSQTAM
jgi:hypothetical protein